MHSPRLCVMVLTREEAKMSVAMFSPRVFHVEPVQAAKKRRVQDHFYIIPLGMGGQFAGEPPASPLAIVAMAGG